MKVSLVSILPFPLNISKPTVHPAVFSIPACERGEITVTHLIDAFCWIFMDGDRGHFKQLIPADQLAQSIIEDYRVASLSVGPEAYPGMMWVEGHLTEEQVRKNFPKELAILVRAQDNWMQTLVNGADDEWNKYHQHRAITGLARTAATYLGLDRAWNTTNVSASIPCPACSMSVFESAVICPHCNFILDETRYKTMKFAGSEKPQLAKV